MAYRVKLGLFGLGNFSLDDLAGAITRMEGACSSPTVCRNNNPGNLTPRAGGWPGQTGVDSRGFAVFDSYQSGYNALITQEQANVNRGLNLTDFFKGSGSYPGFDPGNPTYGPQVASWLGVDPSIPISSLLTAGSGPALAVSPVPDTSAADYGAPLDMSGGDTAEISPVAIAGLGIGFLALLLALR